MKNKSTNTAQQRGRKRDRFLDLLKIPSWKSKSRGAGETSEDDRSSTRPSSSLAPSVVGEAPTTAFSTPSIVGSIPAVEPEISSDNRKGGGSTHEPQGNLVPRRVAELSPPVGADTQQSGKTSEESTATPVRDEGERMTSTLSGVLSTAWNGVKLALEAAEKCLDGTPAKAPVALLNALIKIKERFDDNDSAFNSLFEVVSQRLALMNQEDFEGGGAQFEVALNDFAVHLRQQISQLLHMANQNIVSRTANVQEDKDTISKCLNDLNNATQTHIVRLQVANNKTQRDMLRAEKLTKLCRAPKAMYNADLGEGVSLPRSPCTKGTRESILKGISEWAESSKTPVFWLTGPAGSGKTTIAYSTAVKYDRPRRLESNVALTGNFLCSRQFEETRRRVNIIPTLSFQIAAVSKPFLDALPDLNRIGLISDFRDQIHELLIKPWTEMTKSAPILPSPQHLLVIDALDELNDSEGSKFLADFLDAIDTNRDSLIGLKVLVTSRPDPTVAEIVQQERQTFSFDSVCRLEQVPLDDIRHDIGLYLSQNLPELAGHAELERAKEWASSLFIAAATIVRYLKNGSIILSTGKKLSLLRDFLSSGSGVSQTYEGILLVDGLYRHILRNTFAQIQSSRLRREFLNVVYTALSTIERTSTSIIADLVRDCDDETVRSILNGLHAVLYVRNDRVYWYHASFPDFIFTKSRSNFTLDHASFDYYCDSISQHSFLARSCFQILARDLRFNIAEIQSSYLLDSEDPTLPERVEKNIRPSLRYACQYWGQHLVDGHAFNPEDSSMFDVLEAFVNKQCLFWIEAMNLIGHRGECSSVLFLVGSRISQLLPPDISERLNDAADFSTLFAGGRASSSTPHLYLSSLPSWGESSPLLGDWSNQFWGLPKLSYTRSTARPLITIQSDHKILSVAFAPDGKQIAAASSDGSIRIFESTTAHCLKTMSRHNDWVRCVAFSNDGKWILSGSDDKTIRLWDASSGREDRTFIGHTDWVRSTAFSHDSTTIVSGSTDHSVRIWNTETGILLAKLEGHTGSVCSVSFSCDGRRIVSGSRDKTVRTWDLETIRPEMVLNGHESDVNCVGFSKDGKFIASGSADKSIRIWDAFTGAEQRLLSGHTDWVNSLAFSNHDDQIVSGSRDRSVRIWDVATGDMLQILNGHNDPITSVQCSPDGRRIVSGSSDTTVCIWRLSMEENIENMHGHASDVNSVVFSPDGLSIASGSDDCSIRIWDATTGKELEKLVGHNDLVRSVAFSSDRKWIASGSNDGSVRMWDLSTAQVLHVLQGHSNTVASISIHKEKIASGSWDNSIRVWNAVSGKEEVRMDGHTRAVNCVTFSRDGKHIASASNDGSLKIWDATNGNMLSTLDTDLGDVESVAFSHDNCKIVSGHRGGICVWEASSREILQRLDGHSARVTSVVFSSDDRYIVSGSYDYSVRVWDTSTSREIQKIEGHTHIVSAISFSSDDKFIVSGSYDASIRIHKFAPDGHWEWNSIQDGWLRSPEGLRLMWLPDHIRRDLYYHHTHLLISSTGRAQVDFTDCQFGENGRLVMSENSVCRYDGN